LQIAAIPIAATRFTALLAAKGPVGRIATAGSPVTTATPAVDTRFAELLALAALLLVLPPFTLLFGDGRVEVGQGGNDASGHQSDAATSPGFETGSVHVFLQGAMLT
jgi:hypothetical protein